MLDAIVTMRSVFLVSRVVGRLARHGSHLTEGPGGRTYWVVCSLVCCLYRRLSCVSNCTISGDGPVDIRVSSETMRIQIDLLMHIVYMVECGTAAFDSA